MNRVHRRPEGLDYIPGCFPGRPKGLRYVRRWWSAGLTAYVAVLLLASAVLAQTATYTKDVAPLLADRCAMCHHPGGSAPFSLLTYADAKRRATQIASVAARRYMPPWQADPADGPFVGQHPLSAGEITLLQRWAEAGAPQGDAPESSVVSPQPWTEGWQLGKPDLVLTLPQPYTLPAEGTDAFHIFGLPGRNSRPRTKRARSAGMGSTKI